MKDNPQERMEYAVLGEIINASICGYQDTSDDIFANLEGRHFTGINKLSFTILQGMYADKKLIDTLTFEHELLVQAREIHQELPPRYIDLLLEAVTTPAHIAHYIGLLRRNAYMREIRVELHNIKPDARPEELERILSLIDLRDGDGKRISVTAKSLMPEYLAKLRETVNPAIATGFKTFDERTYAQAGDLIVIGARTNVGKTTFLTNVLVNMLKGGVPCLYCATEMRPLQFLDRISPLVSSIYATKFRSRAFDDGDRVQFEPICGKVGGFPFEMLDIAGPNIAQIIRGVKSSGCKVLFVDYLGRCDMPRENTRMREIEKFVVQLKNLCVEQGILCFLAVQLSRATDFNKDTEPRLADLSDSSAIEKESDAVVFLWKDPANATGAGMSAPITAVLAKNRHGLYDNWLIDFDHRSMRMTERVYVPGLAAAQAQMQAAPEDKPYNEVDEVPVF
jgi:replicative DNA helicase